MVLYDRGLCDVRAYVPPEMWFELLQSIGMTQQEAFGRYDLVVHIQSTCHGAEEVYLAQRPAEQFGLTLEQARQLDLGTLDAWTEHNHRVVVDNSGNGIDEKLERIQAVILGALKSEQNG